MSKISLNLCFKKIKMIDLEIKNHTREKYFAKLENTLKTIKGEK